MGEKEEVTTMVLKVDLQCHKCYKKVKKVLCKFPQIRDQTYDEKQNQVVIKVVCCSPEKIRDKICCKGGVAIKSIEIKKPEKPKPQPVEKPKPQPVEKPKPSPEPVKPCHPPVQLIPCVPICPLPGRVCCMECYHGHAGGPCHSGYGGGPAPYIQYDGYYGRLVYDSYGGGSRGYCEENPSACTIM